MDAARREAVWEWEGEGGGGESKGVDMGDLPASSISNLWPPPAPVAPTQTHIFKVQKST